MKKKLAQETRKLRPFFFFFLKTQQKKTLRFLTNIKTA